MRITVVVAAVIVLLLLTADPALGGIVIDTRPGSGTENIDTSIWVGQTFTAAGPELTLFGFKLTDTGADDLVVSGAVYGTVLGVPTGVPLYVGAPMAIGATGTYSFTPGIGLTVGNIYGIAPQVLFGAGAIWGTSPSIYSGGSTTNTANAGVNWFLAPAPDTAVLIEMTPEPASILLFGLGLAVSALVVRRRSRS